MTREDNQLLGTAALKVEEVPPHHRAAAVRRAACHAHDATDLVMLLDVLGLDAAEGRC